MADAEAIRKTYDLYPEMVTKGDVEGIVALYAADATIEDPIGSELRKGTDAIREFYKASAGSVTMKRTGPVRVAGLEAACPLVILMGPEGEQSALDVISAMVFREDGKVQSMRAWWSFDAIRPYTQEG
jgi:steroid delta-isomerase